MITTPGISDASNKRDHKAISEVARIILPDRVVDVAVHQRQGGHRERYTVHNTGASLRGRRDTRSSDRTRCSSTCFHLHSACLCGRIRGTSTSCRHLLSASDRIRAGTRRHHPSRTGTCQHLHSARSSVSPWTHQTASWNRPWPRCYRSERGVMGVIQRVPQGTQDRPADQIPVPVPQITAEIAAADTLSG